MELKTWPEVRFIIVHPRGSWMCDPNVMQHSPHPGDMCLFNVCFHLLHDEMCQRISETTGLLVLVQQKSQDHHWNQKCLYKNFMAINFKTKMSDSFWDSPKSSRRIHHPRATDIFTRFHINLWNSFGDIWVWAAGKHFISSHSLLHFYYACTLRQDEWFIVHSYLLQWHTDNKGHGSVGQSSTL